MRQREFLKRLNAASKRVQDRISAISRDGGKYGAGLSTEGFDGGYAAALRDVHALLTHGYPNDDRGYWQQSE